MMRHFLLFISVFGMLLWCLFFIWEWRRLLFSFKPAWALPSPLPHHSQNEKYSYQSPDCNSHALILQNISIIKIMQEARHSSVGRSLPTSIFEKFQGIYNEQEHQLKQNDKQRQRMLAKIMEREQEEAFNRKVVNKRLENLEKKQLSLFWQNQEQKLRDMQRKKRKEIDEARKVNNSNFQNLLSKSMEVDAYHLQKGFKQDLAALHDHQLKRKQGMKQFYEEGMAAQSARQDKKRYDRQLQMMISQKKQKQDQQINARRQDFYANWKSKHFQEKHPQVQQLVSNINYQKQSDKAELQHAIAVKGGHQNNQRIAAIRAAQAEHKALQKQNHLKKLKDQTEENTYKAAIDKYLELNYERKKLAEVDKALYERDMREKEQKKGMGSQHLKVLRNQMRPRVLLQQPDKIEAAGIGSPAHIGKIVHDDRIKQLKYIERSYMQQLNLA